MPRGGKRPGSGSPKGNLNAFKHGRRSAQLADLSALLAANPRIRDNLLALGRRLGVKQLRADEVAADLINRLFDHARDIATGKHSPGPFAGLLPATPKRVTRRKTKAPVPDVVMEGFPAESTPSSPASAVEGSNVQPHTLVRRTTRESAPETAPATHADTPENENHTPNNQTPTTNPPLNQNPRTSCRRKRVG